MSTELINLNRRAREIIALSNKALGDIAFKVAENISLGKDNSKNQKELEFKGKYIQRILKVIYNHIEFNSSTGDIVTLHRLTTTQANKFLDCLIKLSDIQDYPVVPKLLPRTKPIIVTQGTRGLTGDKGEPGSDANISVERDPVLDNIKVTEIDSTPTTPKIFQVGYEPYQAPLVNVAISGPTVFEIGQVIGSIPINITTTKGREDIVSLTITNDTTLDDALQVILDLPTLNGPTQPVTNQVSKSSVSTDFSVIAEVTDGQNTNQGSAGVSFFYPYLFGASDIILDQSNLYTSLSKNIRGQGGNITALFNDTDKYFYFAFPATYDNIDTIKDGSSFIVTNDWELSTFDVNSSGLTNNWMVSYKVYRTKIKTNITNQTYQFTHA